MMTPMTTKLPLPAILVAALLPLGGCASRVDSGPATPSISLSGRVIVAPFRNATDDDHAGQAFADLIGTALAVRGLDIVMLPPKPVNDLGEAPPYTNEDLAEAARRHRASGIVRGTAIEFRYKTDLDGDPAAGVYVEILDPAAKNAVWHATSSRTGLIYSSLAQTAQKASRDIVARMPLR